MGSEVAAKIGYVFPGQGSGTIAPGMYDAIAKSKAANRVIREAAEVFGMKTQKLKDICSSDSPDELRENAQKLSVVMNLAYWAKLEETGVLPPPDAVGGHSIGKLSALVVAGVVSSERAFHFAQVREDFIHGIPEEERGSMYAVFHSREVVDTEIVESICAKYNGAVVGCINALNQLVLSGPTRAVEMAAREILAAGLVTGGRDLNAQAGFHSACVKSVVELLQEVVDSYAFVDPKIPFIDDTSGLRLSSGKEIQTLLAPAIALRVCWRQAIASFWEMDINSFREIGPGKALATAYERDIAQQEGQESGENKVPRTRRISKGKIITATAIIAGLAALGGAAFAYRRHRRKEEGRES